MPGPAAIRAATRICWCRRKRHERTKPSHVPMAGGIKDVRKRSGLASRWLQLLLSASAWHTMQMEVGTCSARLLLLQLDMLATRIVAGARPETWKLKGEQFAPDLIIDHRHE